MQIRQVLISLFELLKTIAFVFLIAFIIRSLLVQSFRVEGSSMEPNFHNGEFLLVEKVSYRFLKPRRGDVVVLKAPEQPTIDFIKRIVGLPGETIEVSNNLVRINGKIIKELYLNQGEITEIKGDSSAQLIKTLGQNEYFMLGDNRKSSKDSRSIGPIHIKAIIGKVFIVIWPPGEFGLVPQALPQAL